MAYKVHLIVETITDVASTFYIQNYTEELVFVSSHEVIAERQTTAADSDGYIYTLGGAYWYIHKYNEGGSLILRSGGGKYRRATAIRVTGAVVVLRHAYSGGYRYVKEYNTEDFALISTKSLTRYKEYQGLVFEDADIFYTINRTDKKIEKWNYSTGTKLAEKDLVTSNATGYTIGLAGDNLLLMGKDPDLGHWNHLLITPKDFTGALTKIEILNGAGEEDAQSVRTCDVERDYFLVTFTRTIDSVPPSQNSFLRKYSNTGSLLVEVQVHNPDGALGIHSIPVTQGVGGAEITTQAASGIIYKAAMGNGTIVAGENIIERGFEVKVAVDFFGVGPEIFWNLIGFYDEGEVVYGPYGGRTGYMIKREKEVGAFGVGAFAIVLGHPTIFGNPSSVFDDALRECKSYTYRAYMIIGDTTYFGEWVAFDTPCWPLGHPDDNTPPIYIPPIIPPADEPIIVWEPPVEPPIVPPGEPPVWPPIEPIEPPTFPPIEPPGIPVLPEDEIPDYIVPELDYPDFDYPDFEPSLEGSWIGGFYYRKAYTKKDLNELRKKCRAFLDNSVEYALTLNHNMKVLQQFLNMAHEYAGRDEYNGFKNMIPTQHLNELARKRLNISNFKAIINNFINNSINNAMCVNSNFRLIRNGLEDTYLPNNVGFIDGKVVTKPVMVSDPDVEMLKKKVDSLAREMANNYGVTQHNLRIVRAIIL